MSDKAKPEKMRLCIIIDGDSADELFAVGPNDLRDYFLPEKLGVKSEDVQRIAFSRVDERTEDGWPYHETIHEDNYFREEENHD